MSRKTKETKKEETDEEIELYLNPELSTDYENLKEGAIALNKVLLNVAVDMQVAMQDDETFIEFGGLCVEISEPLAELIKMLPKVDKRFQEVVGFHSKHGKDSD